MVAGIKGALEFSPEIILAHSDSQLVINQVNDEWQVKTLHLMRYYQELKSIIKRNKGVEFHFNWIGRKENKIADHLASDAINQGQGVYEDGEFIHWNTLVNYGDKASIEKLPEINKCCIVGISRINKSDEGAKYRDFIFLKTGGCDNYSSMSEEELFMVISIRFGEDVLNWLKKALKDSAGRFRKDAIRWTARGLHPNLALKKASVNQEMSDSRKAKTPF